jgi:hypothetical protein
VNGDGRGPPARDDRGGCRGGSGWVVVVPLDRAEQCGSNGVKFVLVVAVLAVWWAVEKGSGKKCGDGAGRGPPARDDRGKERSGSGLTVVVPLDRGDQCGSNGVIFFVVVAVLTVWRASKHASPHISQHFYNKKRIFTNKKRIFTNKTGQEGPRRRC